MSYFHRKNCHEPCSSHIKKYLETKHGKVKKEERVKGIRLYNILECPFGQFDENNWDEAMDKTREHELLNGTNYRNNPITHFHLVISPSPEDNLSVDDVLELGEAFIKDAFGDGFNRGKLGCAQVVMIAHNDSEREELRKERGSLGFFGNVDSDERSIPHVHIVVNNIDLQTKKCLHFDNNESKWLYSHIQELCQKRGYHSFSINDQKRKKQRELYRKKNLERGAYITKAERSIRNKGNYSWKFDIRNRVQIAIVLSSNEDEFIANLKKLDITCTKRDDGDYLYTLDKNPTHWKSTGFKLGRMYTPEKVNEAISSVPNYNEKEVRKNLLKVLDDATTIESSRWVTIEQVANVMKMSRTYGCYDSDSYDREIKVIKKKIKNCTNETRSSWLQRELKNLEQAKTDSSHMKIYFGKKSTKATFEHIDEPDYIDPQSIWSGNIGRSSYHKQHRAKVNEHVQSRSISR